MVASAVLVVIMVALGASGRRYRHAAVTRFVFVGASTLYLPIVSYVVSSIGKDEHFGTCTSGLDVECHGRTHLAMLLIWTVLVQIVGTNTSAIVAAADGGGDHKLGPSIELLTRTVWTSYLVFYYSHHGFLPAEIIRKDDYDMGFYYSLASRFLIVLCFLALAKITLKFYAFQKARQSFAFGRNSRLITGYMEELLADDDESCRRSVVPPLIVMGEDQQEIEETPHGYTIRQRTTTSGTLVTLDIVWALASADGDTLLATRPWLKDLCLSFALFKLLRRRFAVTHLVESAKAFSFVQDVLLNSGSPERVFKVIADEISFVLDSYYSSLPTSNFGRLLPCLNIVISLSIISWCLFGCAISRRFVSHHPRQLFCTPTHVSCKIPPQYLNDDIATVRRVAFGNIIFNILPMVSLFLVVIVAEAWEIISYLCSSWIKVTLLCSYVTQPSWQRSPRVQRWLARVLELKINFRRSWNDRMGQIQLLPPPPAPRHRRHAALTTSHRLFLLFSSDPRIKHVQVPLVVKVAIVDALRSSNGRLSKGTAALRRSHIGHQLLWACQARGTSDVILAWHISTGVFDFEASHGGASTSVTSSSTNRTVATRLSRYCVYLMAAAPELLPDDRAWSKKLFDAVSRDIERAFAGDETAEDEGMAVALLNERSEHEVVKRGVKLGKQLLDLAPDEEAGWALLASFWSEMLLFVAPSDSLRAPHKKAIAGDTELLTLVWALLTHTGTFNRTTIRTAV